MAVTPPEYAELIRAASRELAPSTACARPPEIRIFTSPDPLPTEITEDTDVVLVIQSSRPTTLFVENVGDTDAFEVKSLLFNELATPFPLGAGASFSTAAGRDLVTPMVITFLAESDGVEKTMRINLYEDVPANGLAATFTLTKTYNAP